MTSIAERVEQIAADLPSLTDAECVALGNAAATILAGSRREQVAA